jgi:hypothetical protein
MMERDGTPHSRDAPSQGDHVTQWNAGPQPAAGSPSAPVHPVAQLARVHLTGSPRITHVPAVPASAFHEAVARYGAGPDYLAGELPIAMVSNAPDKDMLARGYSVQYVVTDRRVFGRANASNIPLTSTDLPYAQIGPLPAAPGSLAQSLLVPLGYQASKLYLTPKQWHAYLAAMVATVPPPYRTFGPMTLPPTSAADPTGAWAAGQAVVTGDARTWVPLHVLFEANRRGLIDTAVATRHVAPMVLLARGVAYGRGTYQTGWGSVLPRPVLDLALRAVLGEPAGFYPGPAGDVMDVSIGAGSGAGRAVASSIVGVAMLATVGVGWVSTTHAHKLNTVRVHTADLAGGSTFQLFGTSGGPWQPLSSHWWHMVDAVHQALFRLEARYLLGQALFGTTMSPADVLAIPREALEPLTAPLIGPVNLAAFFPS